MLQRMGHGNGGRSRVFISLGHLLHGIFGPVQDELRCMGIGCLLNRAKGGLVRIRFIRRLAEVSEILLQLCAHDERVVVEASVLP